VPPGEGNAPHGEGTKEKGGKVGTRESQKAKQVINVSVPTDGVTVERVAVLSINDHNWMLNPR